MKDKPKLTAEKYKIGDEVWIIERDLTISPKKIVGYKEVDGKITYELDDRFCQRISEESLSKTKIKAEIKKKNFLDDLKFKVGDLIVFEYENWGSKKLKTIGQITKIHYSKAPYEIKGSYQEHNDISDENIFLKVKNEFIEDFGNLQELYEEFEEKGKEMNGIINSIRREHYRLEKELETNIKKQYSVWNWNKSKPLFKDRFTYKGEGNFYD